jgi:serine phosphatase RsbU (regulator of sigma subunit)
MHSLRQAGTTQTQLFAQAVRIALVQSDYATIRTIVRDLSKHSDQITMVAVVDSAGTILAHSNQELTGTEAKGVLKEGLASEESPLGRYSKEDESVLEGLVVDDGNSIAFATPLKSSGVRIGTVIISYSLLPVKIELASAEEEKRKEVRSSLRNLISVGVVVVMVGFVLTIIQGLRMSRPIKRLARRARQMADGDLRARVNIKSRDEIGALGQQFNYMAQQIEALLEDTKEKATLEKELEVASAVQATLVPQSQVAELDGITLAGYFKPALKCGGDWWGYYTLPGGQVLVIISDVTGHGVASAMITAAAKGVATTVMGQDGPFELKKLFNAMNEGVLATAKGHFAMTCFASVYDPKTHTLTYTNAGHNFPYLYDSKNEKLVALALCSSRLGDRTDGAFKLLGLQVKPGDTLIWYTDGLVECEDPHGEEFGERRFQATIREHAHLPPEEAIDKIVQRTDRFYGGTPQKDDITLVVGKIT